MEWRITDAIIPAAVAAVGAALIGVWISGDGVRDEFPLREPGLDQEVESAAVCVPLAAPQPGRPQPGPGAAAPVAGSWPWFRGPEGDGIARDPTPLARSWPTSGPPVLWNVALGEGYAGGAIHDGRVYVLDYDEQRQADTLRCLSLDDGAKSGTTATRSRSRAITACPAPCRPCTRDASSHWALAATSRAGMR